MADKTRKFTEKGDVEYAEFKNEVFFVREAKN